MWLECFQVMDYGLKEWEFGWEFREFGGSAIDDIGDRSTVRVDGVILLLWEMPSAESKANDVGGEFHVGGLRANLGAVVEGEESGVCLLPVWALGDYGYTYVALAVGRVTWFLEYAKEVVAFVFPSAVYIDGVSGGG